MADGARRAMTLKGWTLNPGHDVEDNRVRMVGPVGEKGALDLVDHHPSSIDPVRDAAASRRHMISTRLRQAR